jgi:hypothetical protein
VTATGPSVVDKNMPKDHCNIVELVWGILDVGIFRI